MISSRHIRTQIEEFLEQSQWQKAHLHLGDLWRQESTAATAGYVLSCYGRMQGHLPVVSRRISFLRSMTVEPLIPILRSAALVAGIELTAQIGQFNAYAQEILDPRSSLYPFHPDIVVLAVQTRDILPKSGRHTRTCRKRKSLQPSTECEENSLLGFEHFDIAARPL